MISSMIYSNIFLSEQSQINKQINNRLINVIIIKMSYKVVVRFIRFFGILFACHLYAEILFILRNDVTLVTSH
jgi:hypothetical protein